ncbi:MAG: DUF1361 domain-containing protein [Nitrospirae bacterium]|nr:DUF1361 domain-containing protein [Nitrospirota bacterium]
MKNRTPFFKQHLIFLCLILFCTGIVLFRVHYSGHTHYYYLLWNLFLAVVPYGIAVFIYKYYCQNPKKYLFVLFLLSWLIFYPNAPYLITDFLHLRTAYRAPVWVDVLMYFSLAWTGLVLGFASLRLIHIVFEINFGKVRGWAFVIVMVILGSLGVDLGRYMRFNSWDSIQKPKLLFLGITERILNPSQYLGIYGMTICYSAFFLLAYLSIVYFLFPEKEE